MLAAGADTEDAIKFAAEASGCVGPKKGKGREARACVCIYMVGSTIHVCAGPGLAGGCCRRQSSPLWSVWIAAQPPYEYIQSTHVPCPANPRIRSNVNESGFFSIEVLRAACERFGDLKLLRSGEGALFEARVFVSTDSWGLSGCMNTECVCIRMGRDK